MASMNHVPAWKKLGLKLKFAKNTPLEDCNRTEEGLQEKKRARPEEDAISAAPKPSKKAKASKAAVVDSSAIDVVDSILTLSEISNPPISKPSTTSIKQKSVSFTPETKSKDGESVKQLYNKWLAEQTSDFNPQTSPEALRSITPTPASDKSEPSKVKKPKKAKLSKPTFTGPGLTTKSLPTEPETKTNLPYVPPFLQYLTHHHTSLATWKFNKSKQTSLLKKLFDPVVVPSSYDPALTSYLSGLASHASRSRLCDTAISVLNASSSSVDPKPEPQTPSNPTHPHSQTSKPETMDPATAARKKAYYRQALRDHISDLKAAETLRSECEKEADPAWRKKLLKRQRALLVLSTTCNTWDTGPLAPGRAKDEGTTTTPEGRYQGNNGKVGGRVAPAIKKKRKRKRRTGVPDDDSTSEESSSSSSSSDNDESSGEEAKKRSNGLESSTKDESDEEGEESVDSDLDSDSTESSSESSDSSSSSSNTS